MAVLGEGNQGGQHNQLTDDHFEVLVNRINDAGWFSEGSYSEDLPHNIGVVRMEGRGNLSPKEAITRLNLATEDGELLEGYTVDTDPETGRLQLSYEGLGNERFGEFLEDLARLGNDLDKANIAASPYPEALEQWYRRRQLTSRLPIFSAIEPHLEEELKAVRDHVVIEDNGVSGLLSEMATYVATDPDDWARKTMSRAGQDVETALAAQTAAERDRKLVLALHMAEDAICRVVMDEEIGALDDPEVAVAFAREVLVDNPREGEPLDDKQLAKLLDFPETASTGQAQKLSRFAGVLYHVHRSQTPAGVVATFRTKQAALGNKTPWEVINSGTSSENTQLYNRAVTSRY